MTQRNYPYGMTDAQQDRFGDLSDRLRRYGYWIASEPLQGHETAWLDSITLKLARIETQLAEVRRVFRCRGVSDKALYYLHSGRFDPGFGIDVTHEQREANERYGRKLARTAASWDAFFANKAVERGA